MTYSHSTDWPKFVVERRAAETRAEAFGLLDDCWLIRVAAPGGTEPCLLDGLRLVSRGYMRATLSSDGHFSDFVDYARLNFDRAIAAGATHYARSGPAWRDASPFSSYLSYVFGAAA